MQKGRHPYRVFVWILTGAFLFGTVGTGYAGSEGRKNTAMALTAGALYSLAKRKNGTAAVLGAGSIYAWGRYNQAREAEKERAHRSYASHRTYSRSAYTTRSRAGSQGAMVRNVSSSSSQTAAMQSRLTALEQRLKLIEEQNRQLAASQQELADTKQENVRLRSELAQYQLAAQESSQSRPWWLWAGAPLVLAGLGATLLRRRRPRQRDTVVHIPVWDRS